MAIRHVSAGEVINLLDDAEGAEGRTTTLLKTPRLEVLRMVLPAGKKIPPHSVQHEVIIQCLTGKVVFETRGQRRTLTPQDLLYMEGGDQHALEGLEPSTLLVTILLAN